MQLSELEWAQSIRDGTFPWEMFADMEKYTSACNGHTYGLRPVSKRNQDRLNFPLEFCKKQNYSLKNISYSCGNGIQRKLYQSDVATVQNIDPKHIDTMIYWHTIDHQKNARVRVTFNFQMPLFQNWEYELQRNGGSLDVRDDFDINKERSLIVPLDYEIYKL